MLEVIIFFAVVAFGMFLSGVFCLWVGFQAGKDEGWLKCEEHYKPVLDRWRAEVRK